MPPDDMNNHQLERAVDGISSPIVSPMDYYREKVRSVVRLGTLLSSGKSEQKQKKLANRTDLASIFDTVEPWPEEVDGDALLCEIWDLFDRYVIMSHAQKTAATLWVVHTYLIDSIYISPILLVTSPQKRCGKSTLLALLQRLVDRPLSTGNISPSSVFRTIEEFRPTLLIDEADTFLKNNEELRGLLNAGHSRELAYTIRSVLKGNDYEPRRFSTWGAKVVAMIGRPADTIDDRSICLALSRKLTTERVEKLRRIDKEYLLELKRRLVRWTQEISQPLSTAEPHIPNDLHDRAADNWEPLFAITDLAGGDWPREIRTSAKTLSGHAELDNDDISIQLLGDIQKVFLKLKVEKIHSVELVGTLVGLDDRPWRDFGYGKGLSTSHVANRLRPYDIKPRQMKIEEKNRNGYTLQMFDAVFARYLNPTEDSTPLQPSNDADSLAVNDPTLLSNVDLKTSPITNNGAGGRGVESPDWKTAADDPDARIEREAIQAESDGRL